MPRVNGNITVGVEVECVRTSPLVNQLASAHNFSLHLDHSIRGDQGEVLPRTHPGAGTEIVTRPISVPVTVNGDGGGLRVNTTSLDEHIRAITQCMAHVNSSCGVHIHLGRPSRSNPEVSEWGPDRVRAMLVIGQILENRLFEVVHPSRRGNSHCERIGTRYSKTDMGQFYPVGRVDPVKYNNQKRYCWLNLIETVRQGNRPEPGFGGSPATGTIEIRLLGETMDYDYIQAWTKYWVMVATLVAYVPASMAIAHCCFSDTLEPAFFALTAAYEADAKQRRLSVTSTNPLRNIGSTPNPQREVDPRFLRSRVRPRTSGTIRIATPDDSNFTYTTASNVVISTEGHGPIVSAPISSTNSNDADASNLNSP